MNFKKSCRNMSFCVQNASFQGLLTCAYQGVRNVSFSVIFSVIFHPLFLMVFIVTDTENMRKNFRLHYTTNLYIEDGSSRPEVLCKKGVLRNFAKFTGKHLCQSLFFNKVASLSLQLY